MDHGFETQNTSQCNHNYGLKMQFVLGNKKKGKFQNLPIKSSYQQLNSILYCCKR